MLLDTGVCSMQPCHSQSLGQVPTQPQPALFQQALAKQRPRAPARHPHAASSNSLFDLPASDHAAFTRGTWCLAQPQKPVQTPCHASAQAPPQTTQSIAALCRPRPLQRALVVHLVRKAQRRRSRAPSQKDFGGAQARWARQDCASWPQRQQCCSWTPAAPPLARTVS